MEFPVTSEDLAYLSAAELSALFNKRKMSPLEVAKAALERIDQWNPVLNAYCLVQPDVTLADARASEDRWMRKAPLSPIDGVPYGVKDLLLVKGCPTGFGSRAGQQSTPSEHDAPSVARLKEAGAVFLGKTNTAEFGWKGTGDNPLHGLSPNAWNHALTSGGSSGGAANAAVAGLGTLQLGTDGGGSVRIPAAFSGIAGMKATFGRVAAWPAGPMLTLSHVGPMARTARDVATLFEVIGKPDNRDWNYAFPPGRELPAVKALRGLRIAVYLPEGVCDPGVEEVLRAALARLTEVGVELEEVHLPLEEALELLKVHWYAGAAWLVSQLPQERRSMIEDGFRIAAQKGQKLALHDYYSAMVRRQKFGERMQALIAGYDAVITPTVPIFPFAVGDLAPPGQGTGDWLDWNPFTYPFNLSRQPAISIPAGFHSNGLPVGMQLVGALHDDKRLLGISVLVEDTINVKTRRPALSKK